MFTTYLCGPINGCSDDEANNWRSLVRETFSKMAEQQLTGSTDRRRPVFTLDPMRRDYRGREEECWREIVELDKIDVAAIDAVIASCPKPSVGTSMEILLAHQLGKLIVAVVPAGSNPSPWLRYHAHHIVSTYQDACDLVQLWAIDARPQG